MSSVRKGLNRSAIDFGMARITLLMNVLSVREYEKSPGIVHILFSSSSITIVFDPMIV
jgi:hypothetical protein